MLFKRQYCIVMFFTLRYFYQENRQRSKNITSWKNDSCLYNGRKYFQWENNLALLRKKCWNRRIYHSYVWATSTNAFVHFNGIIESGKGKSRQVNKVCKLKMKPYQSATDSLLWRTCNNSTHSYWWEMCYCITGGLVWTLPSLHTIHLPSSNENKNARLT